MCKNYQVPRSMTSTYSTVVNFSIKNITDRINSIHNIQFILNDLNSELIFPTEMKKHQKDINIENRMKIADLSNDDLNSIVCRVLEAALISTDHLGITVEKNSWLWINFQASESIGENG